MSCFTQNGLVFYGAYTKKKMLARREMTFSLLISIWSYVFIPSLDVHYTDKGPGIPVIEGSSIPSQWTLHLIIMNNAVHTEQSKLFSVVSGRYEIFCCREYVIFRQALEFCDIVIILNPVHMLVHNMK